MSPKPSKFQFQSELLGAVYGPDSNSHLQLSDNFDADQALKNCLSGLGNYSIPNVDLEQMAQCAIPNVPNIDLSQLGGLLQNILDQLLNRLNALDGIFTPKNINLANWFINFCGSVQKGNVKVNVTSKGKK